jgi:alkylation response protein AidB-like acyl-CoA dehydrogenase
VAGDVTATFRALATGDQMPLPHPGGGRTLDRFIALAELSALDLSLGRLFEGHVDALAILAEAGRSSPVGVVMGVWAARRPGAEVIATRHHDGWQLNGCKPWASGAGTLSHALVSATTASGDCLFEVPVDGAGVRIVPGTWPAVGMARSDSADVEFDIVVSQDARVGGPGWYVQRRGFWAGSVGVAACWLGGALGLVRVLQADLAQRAPDPHQLAHLGAAAASCTSMARDVAWAAATDGTSDLRPVALEVRHLVERGCHAVITHVARAGGPGPLCHNPAQARRMADLPVYVGQHHGERDDATLGRILLTGGDEP